MKKVYIIIILLTFIIVSVSCNLKLKKQERHSYSKSNYIMFVENIKGYNIAYTEDGHTLLYRRDSLHNYIVYYAKIDENARRLGYDRMRDRIVRIEIDSTLCIPKSNVSIYGGVFWEQDTIQGYNTFLIDKQMNTNKISHLKINIEKSSYPELNEVHKVRRMIYILNKIYEFASINNISSAWSNLFLILAPVHSILENEIIEDGVIKNPEIIDHISATIEISEKLNKYYILLKTSQASFLQKK